MAVMTIEDGTYQVETIWLEKGYGTPGAAIAQREKTKVSKYEKKQKRYPQMVQKKKNFCLPLQKSSGLKNQESPDCGSLKM